VVQDESERVSFEYLCRGYVCTVWSKISTLRYNNVNVISNYSATSQNTNILVLSAVRKLNLTMFWRMTLY